MVSTRQQDRTKRIILESKVRFRLSGSIYRVLRAEKGGKSAEVIRESVNVPAHAHWPGINDNKPFRFDVSQLNRWSDFEILKQPTT